MWLSLCIIPDALVHLVFDVSFYLLIHEFLLFYNVYLVQKQSLR